MAEATGAPLRGVFVTLTDSTGRQAGGYLSRAGGGFLLRAPGAGQYLLRAELIGYGSVEWLVELGPEQTVRDTLRLPLEAGRLDGIVARGARERQCALRPDQGNALTRLWSEARKGLRIADWAEEAGWLRANGYTYQRVLELVNREVLAESVLPARSLERNAFVAADPEAVRADGFVLRTDDGGTLYRGADAALLLSDTFLQTHCFSLQERAEDGLLGLAFEPIPGRDLPDIRGVLWIDAATGRLHALDYRYTGYPVSFPVPESRFGGHTSFRHLPGGGVAVERWWIRMPTLTDWAEEAELRRGRRCGVAACDDTATLRHLSAAGLAIEEEGGEVLGFRLADGTELMAADRATILGEVVDSTVSGRPSPLSGAEVRIHGTERRAVSDTTGRFRLDDLPEGTYRLVFEHPRLAELGVERLKPVVARAVPGEITSTTLGTPSLASLAMARCRAREAGDGPRADSGDAASRTVLHGVVRDAATAVAIGGASIRLLPPGGEGAAALIAQETDPAGRYLFCDVPPGPARLAGDYLGRGQHEVNVVPGRGTATHIDLDLVLTTWARVVGRVVRAGAGEGAGDGASVGSGAGADSPGAREDLGEGVPDAVVRIRETGQRVVTDEAGGFAFDSVPTGTLTLESEHMAYRPTAGVVTVAGGELVGVELRVAEEVFELPPLVVTTRSAPLLMGEQMGGFYIRQARGIGTFIDRELLDARPAAHVTDLLQELSAIRVTSTATGRILRGGRNAPFWPRTGTRNEFCSPMVYLDGAKISTRLTQDELEEMVRIIDSIPTSEIGGIEVYPGAASVPGEFAGLDTGCGVVAVWTRVSDYRPGAP